MEDGMDVGQRRKLYSNHNVKIFVVITTLILQIKDHKLIIAMAMNICLKLYVIVYWAIVKVENITQNIIDHKDNHGKFS